MYETFDVHASISSDGEVERINTITRRSFMTIREMFEDIASERLLVVRRTGEAHYCVIDLWSTQLLRVKPYGKPEFLKGQFDDIDQAIGWCVLNMPSSSEDIWRL